MQNIKHENMNFRFVWKDCISAYECYSFIVLCVKCILLGFFSAARLPTAVQSFVLTKREIIAAMSNTFFENQNILHTRHARETVYDHSMSKKY